MGRPRPPAGQHWARGVLQRLRAPSSASISGSLMRLRRPGRMHGRAQITAGALSLQILTTSRNIVRAAGRVSDMCRKLPGIRRPTKTALGSAAGSSTAAATAAGSTGLDATKNSRRAAAEARNGAASAAGLRAGRIPAAPKRGAAPAKPAAGISHERVPDQAAGRAALGPLAAGRLHASSGIQVSHTSGKWA